MALFAAYHPLPGRFGDGSNFPLSGNATFGKRDRGHTDLRKPGADAMIAWGISELIRDARQKNGLTTTDLARQIGIDPSSMSRLEEAKANVSIDMLGRVCRALRIGMTERMESGSWIYERQSIDEAVVEQGKAKLSPRTAHFLHPKALRLSNGGAYEKNDGRWG